MNTMKASIVALVLTGALTMAGAYAQTDSAREAMKTKAASIPDKVQTAAGELEFFDGVPIGNTNDLVYDYLDRARGRRLS
jgi:hypothetical protein